jgi:hypothetical protein
MEIAGIIKASNLPMKTVNEIFDQLRAAGERFSAAGSVPASSSNGA